MTSELRRSALMATIDSINTQESIDGIYENTFISYKGKENVKSALRREYTQARESIDKALKRAERAYKKSVANDIEIMSSTNPNEF